MAGMLPGVESARRRRFHGSGGWWSDSPAAGSSGAAASFSSGFFNSTRRSSSFGLTPSYTQRIRTVNNHLDERLGGAAREARERLDERLRAKRKSQVPSTRVNSGERRSGGGEERREVGGGLETEVFGLNKSGSKRFNWGKMRWKASEQEECAVCLDHFKVGESLAHLPCDHRFHSSCLVPWLENNAHCPCCRMPCFV